MFEGSEIRELDCRSGDGIEVALLWEPLTDKVFITLVDARTNHRVRIDVDAAHALDAFNHPYAYETHHVDDRCVGLTR